MIRATLSALALAVALPAHAFDLGAMSDAEKEAFGDAVREYLLENPQVIMEAVAVLEAREAEARVAADARLIDENAVELFNDENSWQGGNLDGDITIVEFADYRCGYCKRAHPEMQALLESDGNIRIVIKEFPVLGEASVLAARFALAVRKLGGDEAYETVHDTLFTQRGDINETGLKRLARDVDLDEDEVFALMESDEITDILTANRELGQRLGVSGTPAFIVGNSMLRGYLPAENMQEIVQQVRAEG